MCSARLRAARLNRLVRAIGNGRGRWQMLTVTVRHKQTDRLRAVLGGLVKSWRLCRQGNPVQPLWSAHVTASARAFEVTHGANGWHPHAHVLVRTTPWNDGDRRALFDRFASVVAREMGPAHVPDERVCLRWSRPLDLGATHDPGDASRVAGYLAKLGLEVTGHAKTSRRGRTHWEVAASAAAGVERDVKLWRDFAAGTRGRRMIEMDRRSCSFAERITAECVVSDPLPCEVVEFRVNPNLFPAIRRTERARPHLLRELLQVEGDDPEASFDARAASLLA